MKKIVKTNTPGGQKIKVLVVPSDRTGVGWGYFRSTKPHITLENNHSDEFHVDIDYEPKIHDDNFLKQSPR
jgi:hypothetical protein